MINSSEYKKIEDEWFDSKRFKKRRLKYLANFVRGIEPGSKNYGIKGEGKRFIRVNDIGSNNKDNVYVNLETDSICNKEDILLCLDGSPGIVVRGFEGIFSTGLRKLELKDEELDYNYLFYSLNCDFSQECINFFSKGTTIMHSSDSTNYLKQPLPPKEEQTKISAYLDKATKKLNKVIENKKRQIEIIEERKLLEVGIKIFYGINSKKLRNSNLEWIKSIPSDWKVRQLKNLFEITLGRMVQPKPKDEKSIFYPYLKAKNMSWNGLKLDEIESMWINFNEFDSMKLQSGDLLVSEGGEVGKSSFFNGEIENCYFQNSLHRVRENEENNSLKYLYYVLFYCFSTGEIDRVSSSVSISHFTYQKIQRFKIPVPSVEEQQKIAKELDKFSLSSKKEIDLLNNQISKLEEYKKILINDVVTGKMKVTS